MFVGRDDELGVLEDLYSRKGSKTCAVYGRRRIGKTTLIDRFCEGKRCIRISFILSTETKNVSVMMSAIGRFTGKEVGDSNDLQSALDRLSDIVREEKTIVFMDEFPYLVESAPHAPSVLQHFIDHELKDTESMLIICGSSVSMMREQISSNDQPLYGRFINHIHLQPLPYWCCEPMHPGMSRVDALKTYMTVGGVPAYHELMVQGDFRSCVERNFLGPSAPLSDESSTVVLRDIRQHQVYEAILSDISGGTVNIKQIAEKEGLTQVMCGRHLSVLERLGLIGTLKPMANTDRKTKIYRVEDNLVDFSHRVLLRNADVASSSNRGASFELLEHDISSFLGHRFEDVCREYVRRRYTCLEVGGWWAWTGEEVSEIDIVARVAEGGLESTVLAECKFRKRQTGLSVLEELERKSKFVKGLSNFRFVIFSASGFTDELKDAAEERRDLELVDLDGLFRF